MQKSIHVDCPTYLELGLTDGEVSTINGKELNTDGVIHVIDYVCQDVGIRAEDVLSKIKSLNRKDGSVTLKLFEGVISAI